MFRFVGMGLLCLVLAGCGEKLPLRVGFIGGLSARSSDVGQAGQNAVLLAVEQINRSGGINGRLIELVSRDDAQSRETALKVAKELVDAKVVAVIGPFTSDIAATVMPVFNAAATPVISPTTTSMDLFGKDDYLFRINRSTRDNALDYARMLSERGQRKISVAFDLRNRSFTESWLNEFNKAFTQLGGTVVAAVPYESTPETDFAGTVAQMLKAGPDGLFFISGALDVARLAQQARKQAPNLPIGASEWAGSEQLLELGGKVVEGLLIIQNHNREDDSARYREFREAYFTRFQRLPGYSSVMAHDAATVLFKALQQRSGAEPLKAALLRSGPYQGLQQQFAFDAFGDTPRKVYFTEIHEGQYRLVK